VNWHFCRTGPGRARPWSRFARVQRREGGQGAGPPRRRGEAAPLTPFSTPKRGACDQGRDAPL